MMWTRSGTAYPTSCTLTPVVHGHHGAERPAHLHLDGDGARPPRRTFSSSTLTTGRFYTGEEEQERAHVCVIGSEAKTKLFSGGYAIGQAIRLKGINFTVIGVLKAKMPEGDSDNNRHIYIPFSTMSDLKDTKYIDGMWMNYQGDNELVEENLRDTLAAAHHFRPSDHNAIFVANLMTQLSQFRILSIALQVLLTHGGSAHPGHRRHWPDEHHAGGRAAAHARDWH